MNLYRRARSLRGSQAGKYLGRTDAAARSVTGRAERQDRGEPGESGERGERGSYGDEVPHGA